MASLIGAVRTTGVTAANGITDVLIATSVGIGALSKQVNEYAASVDAQHAHNMRIIPMEALNTAQIRMIECLKEQHRINFPNQPMDDQAIHAEALRFLKDVPS